MAQSNQTPTDGHLVRRARKGDREAFAYLVTRYQENVYALCRSYLRHIEDAQDVTQETFVCAFGRLAQLATPERFVFWIRQIATNLCRMRLRERKREQSFEVLDDFAASKAVNLTNGLWMEDILEKLAPATRDALVLFAEGFSYADIARVLELPLSTVKSRLRDTRARLRKDWNMEVSEALPADFGARILHSIETNGAVHCFALSPHGRLMATVAQRFPDAPDGDRESEIQIWTVLSGLPLARYVVRSWVSEVVWQNDRTVLFGCGSLSRPQNNGYPSLVCAWDWNADTPRVLTRLESGPVFGLAVDPDNTRLAVATANWRENNEEGVPSRGIVYVYDIAGELLPVLYSVTHWGQAWAVRFSPDGRVLATGAGQQSTNKDEGVWVGGDVRLWSSETGELLHVLPRPHARAQSVVAFSTDGVFVATGDGPEGDVLIYEAQTGTLRHTLHGHTGPVYAVAFSPDGLVCATGSKDGTARLWSVATGAALRVLRGHETAVHAVQFAPDSQTLISADTQRGHVRVWRLD